MAKKKKHNPEKRVFKGRSHKKGGKRVKVLKYDVVIERVVTEAVTVEVEAENEEQASEKAHELSRDGVFDAQFELINEDVEVTNITEL